jgi:4-hydroxy-tetrahydrodipicolinate synthase
MFKPQGIIPPIVTPMTKEEKINEEELRVQLNR